MSGTRIDLWHLDLAELAAKAEKRWITCLTTEELAQAERYLRPATGTQFRVTRGVLRHILAEYIGATPASVPLVRLPMGKPAIDPSSRFPRISFNVSHSDQSALVALAHGREVGVDLETRKRELDVLGMAERFFAPEEAAELQTLSAAERQVAFLRLWTRKEALLKGQGRGLSQDWTDMKVGSIRESHVTLPGWDKTTYWQLHDLDLEGHYVGAMAASGTEPVNLLWHNAERLL